MTSRTIGCPATLFFVRRGGRIDIQTLGKKTLQHTSLDKLISVKITLVRHPWINTIKRVIGNKI